MFGIFRKPASSPVEEERRVWLDSCFLWLIAEFGIEALTERPALTPTSECFPIDFVGSHKNAFEILDIVAAQMDLDPDNIDIELYAEGETEILTGAGAYARSFLRPDVNEKTSSGHYLGKDEDGCFQIGLNSRSMRNVESLIATIAHELAHIKLLGEERLKKNNEPLTDLATVFFGLGIFGANSATSFQSAQYSWSYGRQGYLTEMDWGYALAVAARLRGEKNPEWTRYLRPNVKSDFRRSEKFISENPEKIFVRPHRSSDAADSGETKGT